MKKERISSVDMLRGLVMIIMALDHIRDYSSQYHFDPTDLSETTLPLFFTRWITHFCAPVFMFVAGTGTGLGAIYGKSKKQLSHFLWTRGLWLIILEFTIIRFAWFFNFNYSTIALLVIWALGICMIFLAALIHLPNYVTLTLSLLMIFGHNALDGFSSASFGAWEPFWKIIHEQSLIQTSIVNFFVAYPIIPWVGVMALGYVFADFYRLDAKIRQKKMVFMGILITILFVVIRGANIYGDEHPWTPQPTASMTIASFLNTTKYPPSLSFLLMTLGPSIILLALFEKVKGRIADFLIVFGRVPLFYYVLHLYLIHIIAVIIGWFQGFVWHDMATLFFNLPESFGINLLGTYMLWVLIIALLYPLCLWYMRLKQRTTHPIFSYI